MTYKNKLVEFEYDELASSAEALTEDVIYEFLILRIVGFDEIDESDILYEYHPFILRKRFNGFGQFF